MKILIKNQGGLTLVELIVAMFVGAILIGSVNVVYTNQVYLSQNARDRALLNSYAEGKVEALRSAGFVQVNEGTTDLTSELPSELNPPRSGSMIVTSPSPGLRQVVISVSYNSQGRQLNETYTTFIGELGAGQ